MIERREITGTIFRVPGPYRRPRGRESLGGLLVANAPLKRMTREEAVAQKLVWPDFICIYADFKASWMATGENAAGLYHQYRWKTARYPDAINAAVHGQRVTMTATLEPFHNGIGDYILRPARIVLGDVPTEEHIHG